MHGGFSLTWIEIAAATSTLFVAAVWLAYPATVRGLALTRRSRPSPPVSELPTVSVVVASRDSADAVRSRLANLAEAGVPLSEIIVARDAQAADLPVGELPETVEGVPILIVAGDSPGGKAGALNAGVRRATGEVLVFADTHQRFERGTIGALLQALRDPAVAIVSGSLQLPMSAPGIVRRYWTYERALRRDEARVHSAIGVTGAVYAMRRRLWKPLPPALILDDVYTPMRLVLEGFRVGFAPDAIARETRTPSPGQEYNRKVRTLTGVIQLCAWLPSILVPFRNPVWIQFTFHKLLRMLTPYAVAVIGIWMLLYAGSLPLPAVATLGVATALFVGTAAFMRPSLLRRARAAAVEGVLLQAAVVVASMNGIRGRWQVWDA